MTPVLKKSLLGGLALVVWLIVGALLMGAATGYLTLWQALLAAPLAGLFGIILQKGWAIETAGSSK